MKSVIIFLVGILLGTASKEKEADSGKRSLNLNLNLKENVSPPQHQQQHNKKSSFGAGGLVAPTILLASTLDGTLVALNKKDGDVLWTLDDQPAVKSPFNASKPSLPAFLPDPKDGSIYMIRSGGPKDPLTKLPFTIPELVANSPCRSSDGILYTGRKVDTWFSVDPATGSKRGTISFNGCSTHQENSCPNTGSGSFLIGRTEYNVMMYDSRVEHGKTWNITFYDYSSSMTGGGGSDSGGSNYGMVHFTDSSTGSMLTLDRQTGNVLWEVPFRSPVVAMYQVQDDGIVKVPFTSVSKETLDNLLSSNFDVSDAWSSANVKKLFPTLYIGEHEHGLYAMPSLVDRQTLIISTPQYGEPLLLEGPRSPNHDDGRKPETTELSKKSKKFDIPVIGKEKSATLLFGHYQLPDSSSAFTLTPSYNRLQLTAAAEGPSKKVVSQRRHVEGDSYLPLGYPFVTPDHFYRYEPDVKQCGYNASMIQVGLEALRNLDAGFVLSRDFLRFCWELIPLATDNVSELENKELKAIVVLMVVLVLTVIQFFRRGDRSGFRRFNSAKMPSSMGSTTSSSHYEVTAHPVELENGIVKVGNIRFDPCDVLGKGCEGTFVFKGTFDHRDVAVKRVLAACFSIADREVDLLRESDEHPNVIRYFCMEQDSQFRYMALEYCAATLQDYVEGKYANETLDPLSILRQATQGLFHLHTLDICHRDIKPHNVLISMPGRKGEVRAMISDFGLCKKLKVGRMSFSRKSGVAGTEGWIAPEMMLGNRSTTCLIDIFSLGCVYYFVLSKGSHPFGESFKRQANILSGDYDLGKIEGDEVAKALVDGMLAPEPNLRPPAGAVLRHPLFWNKERKLAFLQEISDHVEKDDKDSAVVCAIERNRFQVVNGNWYDRLDDRIAQDLRQRRTYNGRSIRDLLRALRNKRNHYQELSVQVKRLYGRIPDQFADYWFSRFPKLLMHCWHTMHRLKTEPSFVKYYHRDYDFLETRYPSSSSSSTLEEKSISSPRGEKSQQRQSDNFVLKSEWNPGGERRLYLRDSSPTEDPPTTSGQSSVVSQWENHVVSDHVDEEEGAADAVRREKLADAQFHDMSKPLPKFCEPAQLPHLPPKFTRLHIDANFAEKAVVPDSSNAAASPPPPKHLVNSVPSARKVFPRFLPSSAKEAELVLRPPNLCWAEAVSNRSPVTSVSTECPAVDEKEEEFSSEYSNHSGDNLELLEEDVFEKCIGEVEVVGGKTCIAFGCEPCDKENRSPADASQVQVDKVSADVESISGSRPVWIVNDAGDGGGGGSKKRKKKKTRKKGRKNLNGETFKHANTSL